MDRSAALVLRRKELAHDLGRAAAWCGFVSPDTPKFQLVASAVVQPRGFIAVRIGVTESDRYFERLPIVCTAEKALAVLGYQTDHGRWLNLDQRIFVLAEGLSAHETHKTISFLILSGLVKVPDI